MSVSQEKEVPVEVELEEHVKPKTISMTSGNEEENNNKVTIPEEIGVTETKQDVGEEEQTKQPTDVK